MKEVAKAFAFFLRRLRTQGPLLFFTFVISVSGTGPLRAESLGTDLEAQIALFLKKFEKEETRFSARHNPILAKIFQGVEGQSVMASREANAKKYDDHFYRRAMGELIRRKNQHPGYSELLWRANLRHAAQFNLHLLSDQAAELETASTSGSITQIVLGLGAMLPWKAKSTLKAHALRALTPLVGGTGAFLATNEYQKTNRTLVYPPSPAELMGENDGSLNRENSDDLLRRQEIELQEFIIQGLAFAGSYALYEGLKNFAVRKFRGKSQPDCEASFAGYATHTGSPPLDNEVIAPHPTLKRRALRGAARFTLGTSKFLLEFAAVSLLSRFMANEVSALINSDADVEAQYFKAAEEYRSSTSQDPWTKNKLRENLVLKTMNLVNVLRKKYLRELGENPSQEEILRSSPSAKIFAEEIARRDQGARALSSQIDTEVLSSSWGLVLLQTSYLLESKGESVNEIASSLESAVDTNLFILRGK